MEEYITQLWVKVLAGVDQYMFTQLVELGNDTTQADNFGSCTDDRHDLHRRSSLADAG